MAGHCQRTDGPPFSYCAFALLLAQLHSQLSTYLSWSTVLPLRSMSSSCRTRGKGRQREHHALQHLHQPHERERGKGTVWKNPKTRLPELKIRGSCGGPFPDV